MIKKHFEIPYFFIHLIRESNASHFHTVTSKNIDF